MMSDMNGKKIRDRCLSLLMVIIIAILPSSNLIMAYEPDGGIYNPGKSKDILINIDDEILAGLTEEEFIDKLKNELLRLGADIDTINITLLRRELDATNTADWYVYDHAEPTWSNTPRAWWKDEWGQWDGPTVKAISSGTTFYKDFGEPTSRTNADHSSFSTLYAHPVNGKLPFGATGDRRNATIKSVVDKYGMNGLRLVWQLREHIYAYSTSIPGKDGKFANMIFSGYGQGNMMDYMYYPITEQSVGSIEFDIDRAYVNDHSLFGTGFLINTGLDSNGRQQGYLLYFKFKPDSGTNAIQEVNLYRLNSTVTTEQLCGSVSQTAGYNAPDGTANNLNNYFTKVGTSFSSFPTGAQSHWRVVFSEGKLTVTANNVGSDITTEQIWDISGTGFYGFGPLANYAGHSCARGTAFQFTNVLMATKYTDEFLNLKDASFNMGTDVERYFINLTDNVINDAGYSNPDIYWDTVNRLKSDEVFYLTNKENTILTDGGIKPIGDHLQNGETFTGLAADDIIAELAKYIYNDGDERAFEQNSSPSGGGKPTAVFSLNGQEGTNAPSALQAIEVQRVAGDKPVVITAFDTSVPGAGGSPIVQWVYTIKDPDGNIIDTKVYTSRPTDNDILLEIGPDSLTGRYRIELVVTDENGVSSEKVTRTFEVKKDEIPPIASLGPDTLPVNTAGEYEQAPKTIELSDEGWGVIAYVVEYLQPGTDEPLTGVKTAGGADYTALETVLGDRAVTLSVPNNVNNLPGKYDMRITVYDWAGNETVETFTVNTLKADANKAIADLSGFLTAAGVKANDPDMEIVADLIAEAKRIVAEYEADGGSTNSLTNYSYIAEAQNALNAYNEAMSFVDIYGGVSSISIGAVLSAEDIEEILLAIDAYNNLSDGAKSILGDINTSLEALEIKIGHIKDAASALNDISDCSDPDNVNETTITEALRLLANAEAVINAYMNENPKYTEADLAGLPEYAAYLAAKEVIEAYQEAQVYLQKYSALIGITLNDIPNQLPGMTVDELIAALEDAMGADYAGLSDIAKDNYLEEYKLYLDGLHKKAAAYKEANDLIEELKDIATDPYEILSKFINDTENVIRLFHRTVAAVESYTGTPRDDFAGYNVYLSYADAFDKYKDYLNYYNGYKNVLSLTPDTVEISDIASIENALFVYEGLADPDVKKALGQQKKLLDTLLAKAQDLLNERNALKDAAETLIEGIDSYQADGSINNQNKEQISKELEAIWQKIERFIELGGSTDDIEGYDILLNVVTTMLRYTVSGQTGGGSVPIKTYSDTGGGGSGGSSNAQDKPNLPVNSGANLSGNTEKPITPTPLIAESTTETKPVLEHGKNDDVSEYTDNHNEEPKQERSLPTREEAESLVRNTEHNQEHKHTGNMKEGQFAIAFDENIYIIYDENANPLGYIVLPPGKSLEEISIYDSLIPFGAFEIEPIKENPKTGDNTNTLNPFIITLLIAGINIVIINIRNAGKSY